MKRLRIILRSKYLFKALAVIFLIGTLIFTNVYKFESKYLEEDDTFIGIVTKYELRDDKLVLEIRAREKLIVNYKYGDKIFDSLSYGDKVLVKGILNEPSTLNIPNTFNYKKYLYNNKIFYIVEASSIDKLKNNSNYLYTVKNILYRRIQGLRSSDYVKVFLLGNNTLNDAVNDSYRGNGISHLFSISGMHISLITGMIYFYLDRVTYNKKIKYIIVDIFLVLYYLLVGTSSLLRSIVMNILFSINSIFNLNIKSIDIMFITLIICIVINPFIIYDASFIYSYLISLFLVLCSSIIKKKKGIYKIFIITLISFCVSLPITLYNSYEINVVSIVLNIILVPLVSCVIFPLIILTFIFPIFDDILYFVTGILERVSLFVSELNFTKFIFPKPNIFVVILYYILIVVILYNKKYFYLFIVLIIVHYVSPHFNYNFEVMMFDVGEADSILISYPFGQGNILVDTGKYEYTMTSGIIPYLKSNGIRKLDYLIITHGDLDHIGGAISLIENFDVEYVIFNRGEYSDLEIELIDDLGCIKSASGVDKIRVGNRYLYFLNDKVFDNENDNSNVLYFEYLKYKFLFMGDASFVVEDYLLEKYNLSNISFLKVGHHGSSTSSDKTFIEEITPSVSLISVGVNNYGHPNKQVLDNLEDSRIYRTDMMGSVRFRINRNNVKVLIYMS